MIHFTPRLWSSAGSAALLAGALAACSPGGEAGEAGKVASGAAVAGETGGESGGEGKAASIAAPAVAAAAAGESGGGEAGAATAYAGLDADAAFGLRLEHIRGFILVAREAYDDGKAPDEASALVGQGFLEAYDPAAASFAAINNTEVKATGDALVAALDSGKTKTEVETAFVNALRALDKVAPKDGSTKAITEGLLTISTGLYSGVVSKEGDVDAIEFQHSYGAALAALDTLTKAKGELSIKNQARYDRAMGEMHKFVALWGGPIAPEKPPSLAVVQAQASRIELALSGL
jgi:hypothetical protein